MTKFEMIRTVQAQLAIDLNCTIADLNGEKDSFVFTEAKENPGRRPFPRGKNHFELLSMGNAIIVSATPEIMNIVRPQLQGKSRDQAFSMPFFDGNSIYYLPDLDQIHPLLPPTGFTYELVDQRDIPPLYQFEGFHDAIQYDVNHPRPDVLVTLQNTTIKSSEWPVPMPIAPRCGKSAWMCCPSTVITDSAHFS